MQVQEIISKMLRAPASSVAVIYHAGCHDGFASALVTWYVFGDEASYIPTRYDSPFDLSFFQDKNVIIVDFSFKRPILEQIASVASNILVLDHHLTAEEALKDLPYCFFDPKRSGARMAFDAFNQVFSRKAPFQMLETLVSYIEDRDLWNWKLPESRAINAALGIWPRKDFMKWHSRICYPQEAVLDRLILEGDVVLEQMNTAVRAIAANAREREFCGLPALEVNGSYFWSEVGDYLGSRTTVVLIWVQQRDGTYRYELRTKDPSVDVGQLAKKFGGGGHKAAAGFFSAERI